MAEPDEEQPVDLDAVPVPDLIARYRLRRDEWIAQADELARLRDDVRGAAEREAMEIVTAARRDVRRIVMEARRELLVLSAQVQAVLGEQSVNEDGTPRIGPVRIPHASIDDHDLSSDRLDAPLVGEAAVKEVLEEARADMAALAEEARAVPFHVPPPLAAAPDPPPPPAHFLPEIPLPDRSTDSFRTDATPGPRTPAISRFVAMFVVLGVALLVGIVWWWSSSSGGDAPNAARATTPAAPTSSPTPVKPAPAPATTPAPPRAAAPAPAAATPVATPLPTASAVSVLVEARRPAWVRATIDGRSDVGRTMQTGEKITLNAARSVSLRVGDAGAVVVSVNKGQARPLGRDGEVVTREFGAARPVSLDTTGTPATPAPAPLVRTAPPTATPPTAAPISTPTPVARPAAQTTTPAAAPPSIASTPPPARVETPREEQRAAAPAVATPPPSAPAPRPEPANAAGVSRNAVIAAAQQWLDAYQRQDRTTLAALSTENMILADERRADERVPPGTDARRTLEQISVQIAADTAVVTAVMTERADASGVQRVSPVSQVWVYGDGKWRARQVRLVSEAALNRIFR